MTDIGLCEDDALCRWWRCPVRTAGGGSTRGASSTRSCAASSRACVLPYSSRPLRSVAALDYACMRAVTVDDAPQAVRSLLADGREA